MKPKYKDISGQRFGTLTAIRYHGNNSGGSAIWVCLCDCGKEHLARGTGLRYGEINSCGCTMSDMLSKLHTKHGNARDNKRSREYCIWLNMKQRCNNPKNTNYKYYGARGIKLCDSWNNSFESFLEEMGAAPSIDHTIDRDDVNGDYNKANCNWVLWEQQIRNKRKSIWIEYDGRKMILAEWSRELGIHYSVLMFHIRKNRSIEQILNSKKNGKKIRQFNPIV